MDQMDVKKERGKLSRSSIRIHGLESEKEDIKMQENVVASPFWGLTSLVELKRGDRKRRKVRRKWGVAGSKVWRYILQHHNLWASKK